MKGVKFIIMAWLLLVCGCSADQEKKLVGKWQETTSKYGVLEFSSDHSGRAFWPNEAGKQESSAMKWQILKGENRVAVITPLGPVIFEIKSGRLVAPNGVVLTKVK